jgi:hypothetical protein
VAVCTDPTPEDHEDSSPRLARDLVDPATVVAAMASAVEHVRQLAATVFKGDAALFGDPTEHPRPSTTGRAGL